MAYLRRIVPNLDVFRRVEETYLTGATAHGVTLTLVSYVLMAALAVFECSAYLYPSTLTTVLVDVNNEESLLINFNITMLALPCNLLSIKMYDQLGWFSQRKNIEIWMTRLHMSNGKLIAGEKTSMTGMEIKEVTIDEIEDDSDDDYMRYGLNLEGGEEFENELKKYDYTLIAFYTSWCRWCKALGPIFFKAAEEFDHEMLKEQKNIKARFASIDCETYSETCDRYKVVAYPTLLIFHRDGPIYPVYNGERTAKNLVKFLLDAVIKEEISIENTHHDQACLVEGVVTVPRVPGTFQIEAVSSEHDISPQMANLSHIVHSLHFGESLDSNLERRLHEKQQFLMHPLNGKEFLLSKRHLAPQHYIQIVTAFYEFGDGSQVKCYQFTSQNRIAEYKVEQIPHAKFSYVLSAVSIVMDQRRSSFYSFITSLLAIVGGAFTVVSLLNTTMDTVGVQLKKSLGKFH
jgi:thiol-disulfide isomerase/thioredoxin